VGQFPHVGRAEAQAIYALCEGNQEAATLAIVAEDEKRFLAAHPGWAELPDTPQGFGYTEIKGAPPRCPHIEPCDVVDHTHAHLHHHRARRGVHVVVMMTGDLFESKDSLAHCVSECLAMGKGVATGFKELFGGVDELRVHSHTLIACSDAVAWDLTSDAHS
jgi:hypothetical protein